MFRVLLTPDSGSTDLNLGLLYCCICLGKSTRTARALPQFTRADLMHLKYYVNVFLNITALVIGLKLLAWAAVSKKN